MTDLPFDNGREEGREEGELKRARKMLLKTLNVKFGAISDQLTQRINGILSVDTLDELFEKALECATLDAFQSVMEQ